MNNDERKTDPAGLTITHDDILSYLVGAMQRVEAQMADIHSIVKKVSDIDKRVTEIEIRQERQEALCKIHHPKNGQSSTRY